MLINKFVYRFTQTNIRTSRLYSKKFLAIICLGFLIGFKFSPSFSKTSPTHTHPKTQCVLSSNLYSVKRIHGERRTSSGLNRTYVLYIPQSHGSLTKQPYPVVEMVHGFLMSSNQQSTTCRFLAERGFVVLAPNMSRIMLGSKNRTENVKDVVEQMSWLIKQSQTPSSQFFGLCDASRVAIAGNSSGGAICFEAVLEAQRIGLPFHSMCSLEGVPWDRTLDKVKEIHPMDILTLRAEACLCNYHYNVLRYVQQLNFATTDVKVNGAHHCDAENPTTFGCMSVCGTSHKKYRQLFELITYLYLRDSLNAPKLYPPTKNFVEVMNDMQKEGKVLFHSENVPSSQLANN